MDMTEFRIVNDVDRPSEELIAKLAPDGKLYYLHPTLAGNANFAKGMDASESTSVEEFGVELQLRGRKLYGHRLGASRAKYRNGNPRYWQGAASFSLELPNSTRGCS